MLLHLLWKFVLFTLCLSISVRLVRADTVILKNSDRLTGEIQKLEKDRLSLKTVYAGMVNIDWKMIEAVYSKQTYRIETQSGLRMEGIIGGTVDELTIQTASESVKVPFRSVIAIKLPSKEQSERGWDRVHGSLDFGYSITRGNSITNQSSLGFSAEYRGNRHKVHLDATSLFSRQAQPPTTSRHFGSLRYDLYIAPRAFIFGLTSLEHDGRQQLCLRTNAGGGFGLRLMNSDRIGLSLLGGLTFANERYMPEAQVLSPYKLKGEGLLSLSLEQAQIKRLRFKSKLSLFPDMLKSGRYRVVMESELGIPILGRLTWSLRIYDQFDNRPPLDVVRNDYGMISSFGLVFR